MHDYEQRINRSLMIGWSVIIVILLIAYFGEFLKGMRTASYMLAFSLVTVLPALVCFFVFLKSKGSKYLRYLIIAGYFFMYIFVLLTGNTTMVFTYIFPLLTLIVLYHQPKLVLYMGITSLIVNLIYDMQLYMNGQITVNTSKDVEIQIALIILCFSFLYIASRMYDDIQKKNNQYLKEIEKKNEKIQQVTLETITTIANIIDAKDEYTRGHSQRVAEYSSAIAKEMGYSENEIKNIRYIALLHDIGKVGITDSILKKAGHLSDEEYQEMKRHTTIGANILQGNTFIDGLEKGAKYHHERYDGTGYGEGLKGDDIPEIARIICVADAFDAMTSDRVYRTSLSDETAISELKKNSGSQFDPEIANVFLKLLKEHKIDSIQLKNKSETSNQTQSVDC